MVLYNRKINITLQAALGGNPPSDPNPGRTKARLAKVSNLQKIVRQYKTLPMNSYMDALVAHFTDA